MKLRLLKVEFLWKLTKNGCFNDKIIYPRALLEIWNNFLLTPALNTTHVSKLQSLPADCDCSASIFCTILAKAKIFQCWKYSCNRPPRALKQLSSNIRNKVNSNKFHEMSTTPILLRCDCLKLAFSIKMAKINTSVVKILAQ